MATDTTTVGLCLVKINNTFYLDAKSGSWSVKRTVNQDVTGGGVRQSTGTPIPSVTLDSVVPRTKDLDWSSLKDFSVEIVDKENKTVVFAMTGSNWNSGDGTFDLGSARTSKRVAIAGTDVTKW